MTVPTEVQFAVPEVATHELTPQVRVNVTRTGVGVFTVDYLVELETARDGRITPKSKAR